MEFRELIKDKLKVFEALERFGTAIKAEKDLRATWEGEKRDEARGENARLAYELAIIETNSALAEAQALGDKAKNLQKVWIDGPWSP